MLLFTIWKYLQNSYSNFPKVQFGWSCTKFSPQYKMLYRKMKVNMLMISTSIVSSFALIVFLKSDVSIRINILHIGYWSFLYGNLLVGLDRIITSGYMVAWTFLDQVLAIYKILHVDQVVALKQKTFIFH